MKTMKASSHRAQKGFTLVEIAVVLVIIGLLLGGVLKGQELIESARVKNATNLYNSIASGVNGYRDRYRNMPGDDCCAASKTARGANWASAMTGNGQNTQPNGIIDDATVAAWGAWNGWQHVSFWLDLYAGGFLAGDATARSVAVFPRSPWGGVVDIVNVGQVYGMVNNALVICMATVPGKAANQLDLSLDDGNPATGSLRSAVGNLPVATTPTVTAYSEDATYMVCRLI
jgi:prepilin-type N-terminal cleavage/methylation domain-containing protein